MGKPKTEKINHLNYPDDEGRIFCRLKNDIKIFEPMDCRDCPLCYGSIQGMGVECFYPDLISENNTALALTVPDPDAQMKWIAALVDKNMIPADPL